MQASITAEPSATPISLPDPRSLPSRRRSKLAAPTSSPSPQADKPTAPPKPPREPGVRPSVAVAILSLKARDLAALRFIYEARTVPRAADGSLIGWDCRECVPVDVMLAHVGDWLGGLMTKEALRNAALITIGNVGGREVLYLTPAGESVAARQPRLESPTWEYRPPCPSCGTPPTIAPTTPTTVTTE